MSSPFWKKFEADVYEELKRRQKKLPLIVHRFYDTHSAGNLLPNQPGDFLIVYRGHAILLELKSSEVHKSLRSCFSNAVPSSQIAHHALWRRAKATCWFLFLTPDKRCELWPAKEVVAARLEGRRLNASKNCVEDDLDAAITIILEERDEDSFLQRHPPR